MKFKILLYGALVFVSCNHTKDSIRTKDSECEITVEQEFLTDSVLSEFKLEFENQNILDNFSIMLDSTVNRLEQSKTNKNLLWPFSPIDSAKYFRYEDFDVDMSKHDLKDREIVEIIILCDKKISAIVNLMNNPNYFGYGDCGTAIPESDLKFYYKGKIIGEITFACGYLQTSSLPFNTLNKFGGLNNKGKELLYIIEPWR